MTEQIFILSSLADALFIGCIKEEVRSRVSIHDIVGHRRLVAISGQGMSSAMLKQIDVIFFRSFPDYPVPDITDRRVFLNDRISEIVVDAFSNCENLIIQLFRNPHQESITRIFAHFLFEQTRTGALGKMEVLLKDFKPYFTNITESLKSHIENGAKEKSSGRATTGV